MLCTDYHVFDNPLVQSDLQVFSIDLSLPHSPETEPDGYAPLEMSTLPSAVTDYMAETVCDMIPIVKPATCSSPLPELVYFIHKMSVRSHMDWQVAIIALIYLHRCKRALPKGAVGNPDTAHRMFLAAVLIASKFVQDANMTVTPRLTNQKLCSLCDGMYTLRDIGDLERAFLKILKYRCWVSHDDIHRFLYKHRADLLL
ncbi:hypothetical protein K450DRAFT_282690 [Umbelopsis ramanniana AG]|uniref:Cyclin N-terminal domain-containing protein n=1 Tax=Umbelopsis ramanniana AG TaxID=1314678 RepID=A0AAD5E5T1_UMBRA|nr:uncharacterized protein K450DRAFT_282690 [Umbelopsis ramanniana AG]KAI8577299.1 hypothetical protein K450DRAFT_282690 [Umbelopsis ramanniana AG]